MQIVLSNCVRLEGVSQLVKNYCNNVFWYNNPEYYSKERLGIWTGDTPRKMFLFQEDMDAVIVPVGLFPYLKRFISPQDLSRAKIDLADNKKVDFGQVDMGLYDYQEKAVKEMLKAGYGILQSKAGSGKTQMGVAMAIRLGYKTLWLTHTRDLLKQSYDRAAMYLPKDRLGKITDGKVQLGDITFATVQTMCKLDLAAYKYCFNTVIVDECHRVCGSPARLGQFSRVLSNLAARHKYGLSATVHRADGTEKAMFAYLGDVKYRVPEEAVADKVMPVKVIQYSTGITLDPEEYTDFDGTIVWAKYITALAEDKPRQAKLAYVIKQLLAEDRSVLVLADRISLLKALRELVGQGWVLTGESSGISRKLVLEQLRKGESKLLLSTYALAKEGLDIPCLDTLVMATPVKDYAVVIQAVGRVARVAEGKKEPLIIDVLDRDDKSVQLFKTRCRHYKKEGIAWK